MHVDSCGLGAESDFTPRAGSEDRDVDAHNTGNGTHIGHKRSRGGQVRLACTAVVLVRHPTCCWLLKLNHAVLVLAVVSA
jgi:hypothetical protein